MKQMGKQRKILEIEGQLSFDFDFCTDTEHYVVQANDLIGGKQALSLNAAKIIRAAIMQIQPDDTELKPYRISIQELSDLLSVSASNLYRDIDEISDNILKNPLEIKEPEKERFAKFAWAQYCAYDGKGGFILQLNECLKPFLIRLKEHYTQYSLQDIIQMKSVYSIRIYEIIQSTIKNKMLSKNGDIVQISLDELREITGTENKPAYEKYNNFKRKVIDVACDEINEKTMYDVSYQPIKQSRRIVGIAFFVNMKYHTPDGEPERTWKRYAGKVKQS